MGWFGCGLFSGDSPMNWLGKIRRTLECEIDKVIEKGYYLGVDTDDVPALIFFYADFLRHYERRVGKLHTYIKWLHNYKAEGWKHADERLKTIKLLADEIESLFVREGEGYKDIDKYTKIESPSKEFYHLTTRTKLSDIRKNGLIPQRCFAGLFENKTGIYVSSSLMGCLKWRFHCLGHLLCPDPAIIRFTSDHTDEIYCDGRVDFKDDFIVCNSIPAERLTIFS
jgi:hypothetical protein